MSNSRSLNCLLPNLASLILCLLAACSQEAAPVASSVAIGTSDTDAGEIAYEEFTLDNGLQVILHIDRSDPVVAVVLTAHVGSARELPGRTGFAHLFEHLLFLESENPTKDIAMYINSPGGIVTSGLAIYDTMEYIRPDVSTVCMGQAASMGSLLLTAGAAGKRFSLPNARIMTHQPSGGFSGQASDIEIHAKEILDLRRRLNGIYEKHTGKTLKQIEKIMERDTFMTAEDARDFGLIDEVVEKRPVPESDS